MGPGRVVLLNGPSRAGKTTLAHAVAERQPTPWLVLPDELDRRERARSHRDPGTVRAQRGLVFDTTAASPEDLTDRVVALLEAPPRRTAFHPAPARRVRPVDQLFD